MGAAALGGGLVVHYSERPADISLGVTMAPKVVARPVVPHDPIPPDAVEPTPQAPARREKPSALGHTVHAGRATPVAPPRTGSVHIPLDPPAVVALDIPPDEPAAPLASSGRSDPVITPAAPPPNHVTLPAGMLITVRIIDRLSSDRNSQGDVFSGSLERPVIAEGFVIAERGARVRGEDRGRRGSGRDYWCDFGRRERCRDRRRYWGRGRNGRRSSDARRSGDHQAGDEYHIPIGAAGGNHRAAIAPSGVWPPPGCDKG